MQNSKHNFINLFLLFTTLITYSIVIVLNQLASKKILFPSDVGSISRLFPLDITPHPIVFPIIWSIIYAWQALWLIYALVFHFRRTEDNDLLYRKMELFHPVLFLAFIGNNLGMIAWLFLWTNKLIGWSFAGLLFLTLALYLTLYISHNTFYIVQDQLLNLSLNKDIWMYRIFVQNGLAFYVTWTTVATLLNFASYLTYDLLIEKTISTTCALCILGILIVLYSSFENFVWQKYLLFTFTPWLVLLTGLSGSLAKNYPQDNSPLTRNNILTICLLILCAILFVVKIVMFSLYRTIWRAKVDKKESHRLLQEKQNNSTS